jgi:hypothetical protein
MPLDLHAKGFATVRNIQIEPNPTKQKRQFVLRTGADPLTCRSNGMLRMPLDLHAKGSAPVCNIQIEPDLTKQK